MPCTMHCFFSLPACSSSAFRQVPGPREPERPNRRKQVIYSPLLSQWLHSVLAFPVQDRMQLKRAASTPAQERLLLCFSQEFLEKGFHECG